MAAAAQPLVSYNCVMFNFSTLQVMGVVHVHIFEVYSFINCDMIPYPCILESAQAVEASTRNGIVNFHTILSMEPRSVCLDSQLLAI